MTFNKQKALEWIEKNIKPKSTGYCCRYVCNILEVGGVKVNRVASAKDLWKSLEKLELMKTLDINKESDILPHEHIINKIDHIAIFSEYHHKDLGHHPHGHCCINIDGIWYSDFKQKDIYGGKGLRACFDPKERDKILKMPTCRIYSIV